MTTCAERSRPVVLEVVLNNSVGVRRRHLLCIAIALPAAFYIAKVAKPLGPAGARRGVLLPLWAGYLVKGYAWKAMLRPAGVGTTGVPEVGVRFHAGLRLVAVVLALSYLWLPYMVLPIYAGLDRLPPSLLDASGDLGAPPHARSGWVVVPMLVPSIAAGSMFTFSAVARRLHHAQRRHRGADAVHRQPDRQHAPCPEPTARGLVHAPAAAIIVVYLTTMRRFGAFESL